MISLATILTRTRKLPLTFLTAVLVSLPTFLIKSCSETFLRGVYFGNLSQHGVSSKISYKISSSVTICRLIVSFVRSFLTHEAVNSVECF